LWTDGLCVVVRELGRVLVPAAPRYLEPLGITRVQPRARRRRQAAIRHLAGESVREREFGPVASYKAALRQRFESRLLVDKRAQGRGGESPTDYSGGLEGGLRGRREPVDALREQRLDGVRDDEVARDLVRYAPVGQHPHDLLDEERIAVRALDHKCPQVLRQRLRGKA